MLGVAVAWLTTLAKVAHTLIRLLSRRVICHQSKSLETATEEMRWNAYWAFFEILKIISAFVLFILADMIMSMFSM